MNGEKYAGAIENLELWQVVSSNLKSNLTSETAHGLCSLCLLPARSHYRAIALLLNCLYEINVTCLSVLRHAGCCVCVCCLLASDSLPGPAHVWLKPRDAKRFAHGGGARWPVRQQAISALFVNNFPPETRPKTSTTKIEIKNEKLNTWYIYIYVILQKVRK